MTLPAFDTQADVVTPNQFEVEQLTGISIQTIQDAQRACAILHDSGVSLVLITSIVFPEGGTNDRVDAIADEDVLRSPSHDSIGMFASCRQCKVADETEDEQYIMFTPKFPGHFTGTGDVCAALFLGWTADKEDSNDNNLACSLEKLAGAMNAIVERTAHFSAKKKQSNSSSSLEDALMSAPELQLVQSRDDILHPPRTFHALKVSTNGGK